MSKYREVKHLLRHLIGSENILSNNIVFIDFTGSHEKAQFLSQLYYWNSRTKIKGGWIAKRHKEWYDEIRIKPHSIRRFSDEFEKNGFLEIKLKKFDKVTMPHYRLNEDVLIDLLVTFCKGNNLQPLQIVTPQVTNCNPSQDDKLLPSINRDYTETITEIKKENAREKITTSDIEDFEQFEKTEQLKTEEKSPKKVAPKKGFENEETPNWMEVALAAIEYATEEGKAQWEFMCRGAGGYVDPGVIMTNYFGKHADSPYILRNWKKEIPKMGNWIKNELKAIQKNGKQTGPKKHLVTPDQLDQVYRELRAEGYE